MFLILFEKGEDNLKKVYVLDTNIPLLDPDCLSKFEDNDIVFSTITIKELDKMKKRIDEVGKNARLFNKKLGELSESQDLFKGIPLEGGGTLRIETNFHNILKEIESVFFEIDNDDRILAVAIGLHRKYMEEKTKLEKELEETTDDLEKEFIMKKLNELKPVILVSRDNNLRIRARYFNLPAESYTSEQITHLSDLHNGWRVVPVPSDVLACYYGQRGMEKQEDFEFNPTHLNWKWRSLDLKPNEYIVLVDESDWNNTNEDMERISNMVDEAALLKYDASKNVLVNIKSYRQYLKPYNIYPTNLQQKLVIDMLFNKEVPLKSIIGLAGSGKTLLALLASIIMVNDLKWYDEIIITRPPVPMEYDMGFLPGGEQEKMDPYLRGFQGNMEFITSRKYLNKVPKDNYSFDMYNIKTESMTYMRGKTIHRKILIIDEAQNSTLRAMKTALTRIGDDSIIILLGDISQIDHHLLDATNNGLTHAVELMKNDHLAAHVTLLKGERSELSEKVAQKWDKHLS